MWDIFQNIWVRGKLKACVVKAKTYIGIPLPGKDSCVLTFGGLTDNAADTGISGNADSYLLQDGHMDFINPG